MILLVVAARAYAADLILNNGKIVTLDPAQPQAEAIAITGGKITALGTNRQIPAQAGPGAKVIDLGGRLAIPGFIEGHGHFLGLGQSKMTLNLNGARTWDQIVAMVAAAAKEAKPGAWIHGRGWHQEKWDKPPQPNVEGFPLEAALSRVSPRNPVLLTHASGHAAFANAAALKLGGVTAKTPNPAGGEILHDARATPPASSARPRKNLVRKAIPPATGSDDRRAIDLAIQECLAKGITSFQDAGSPPETIELVRRTLNGRLRLWMMLRAPNARLAQNLAALPHHRPVPDRARHQAPDRRRAGIPRRLAARAVCGPARQAPASTRKIPPISRRPPRWPSQTAINSASTPSAIAPIAKCSISTSASSAAIRTRRTCAGASSTPSTSARPTSRDSQSWA